MAKKKRFVPLSEDLEKLALAAIMKGAVEEAVIHEEELSKIGKLVLQSIKHLRRNDAEEINPASVQAVAAEILGADHREIHSYIASCFSLTAGKEIGEIVRTVRDKSVLVEVLNEVGNQLATGAIDLSGIASKLDEGDNVQSLTSAADLVADGLPEEPRGLSLKTLPMLTEASGGLMGMWALASEAGVGKSTLSIQLAIEYGRVGPVLYYDMENGPEVMLYRVGKRYGGNVENVRKVTKNIYFRETIRTLSEDLRTFKGQPCLIIVDSLQKLPTSVEHRRTSLDVWVHRFERLKKDGHTVVLISEKNREEYGSASQRGFKETGEIEYSCDFGFHLIQEPSMPNLCKVIIVKNRHRPVVGSIGYLERVNGFRFVERA